MNVYTYFDKDESLNGFSQVLDIWEKSWKKYGWNPVVLGNDVAMRHPLYELVYNHVEKLPTSNPKKYEMSCWLRWLAMESIGGGLHTDSDVFNYGLLDPFTAQETTILDFNRVPCAVWVGKNTKLSLEILKFKESDGIDYLDTKQCSDMIFFQKTSLPTMDMVREINSDGYKESALVHFATSGLAKSGHNKENILKAISDLRPIDFNDKVESQT
jgi:hypothetical protein